MSFLALPPEVLTEVVSYLDKEDLQDVRLVCRSIESVAIEVLGKECFAELMHIYSFHSLQTLAEITNHKVFGKYVKKVLICTARLLPKGIYKFGHMVYRDLAYLSQEGGPDLIGDTLAAYKEGALEQETLTKYDRGRFLYQAFSNLSRRVGGSGNKSGITVGTWNCTSHNHMNKGCGACQFWHELPEVNDFVPFERGGEANIYWSTEVPQTLRMVLDAAARAQGCISGIEMDLDCLCSEVGFDALVSILEDSGFITSAQLRPGVDLLFQRQELAVLKHFGRVDFICDKMDTAGQFQPDYTLRLYGLVLDEANDPEEFPTLLDWDTVARISPLIPLHRITKLHLENIPFAGEGFIALLRQHMHVLTKITLFDITLAPDFKWGQIFVEVMLQAPLESVLLGRLLYMSSESDVDSVGYAIGTDPDIDVAHCTDVSNLAGSSTYKIGARPLPSDIQPPRYLQSDERLVFHRGKAEVTAGLSEVIEHLRAHGH
ncbi:hypothetical protein H2203_001659 [Taxawa tesnikishii (nom. ined.)]|nr:hypothetical protein H2203_001659 [Dothideales sp. JES 119]